jgi:hypothetical protein
MVFQFLASVLALVSEDSQKTAGKNGARIEHFRQGVSPNASRRLPVFPLSPGELPERCESFGRQTDSTQLKSEAGYSTVVSFNEPVR